MTAKWYVIDNFNQISRPYASRREADDSIYEEFELTWPKSSLTFEQYKELFVVFPKLED